LDPAFHDRVHARHQDPTEHNVDTGVGEDAVEQGRVLAVPVADQVSRLAACVVEVDQQVPGGLGDPGGGRVSGDSLPAIQPRKSPSAAAFAPG